MAYIDSRALLPEVSGRATAFRSAMIHTTWLTDIRDEWRYRSSWGRAGMVAQTLGWLVLAAFVALVAWGYLTETDGLYPSDNPALHETK